MCILCEIESFKTLFLQTCKNTNPIYSRLNQINPFPRKICNKDFAIFHYLKIWKSHGKILRVCFQSWIQNIGLKVKKMVEKTKFIPFSLSFCSKMGFSKVNISKTAWETYPQNFTMIFTCLKLLKTGFIFGGVFFLRMDFGSTYCVWLKTQKLDCMFLWQS